MGVPKFIRVAGQLYQIQIDKRLRVGNVTFHYAAELAKPVDVSGSLEEMLQQANLNASTEEAKEAAGRMLSLLWTIGEYINTKSPEELGVSFFVQDVESGFPTQQGKPMFDTLFDHAKSLYRDKALNTSGRAKEIMDALMSFAKSMKETLREQLEKKEMKQPEPIRASARPRFIRVDGALYKLREAAEPAVKPSQSYLAVKKIIEGLRSKNVEGLNAFFEKHIDPGMQKLPGLMVQNPDEAVGVWDAVVKKMALLQNALGKSDLAGQLQSAIEALSQDIGGGAKPGQEIKPEGPAGIDWGAHAPEKASPKPGEELTLTTEHGGVPQAKQVDWGKFAMMVKRSAAFRRIASMALQTRNPEAFAFLIHALNEETADQNRPQFIRIEGTVYRLVEGAQPQVNPLMGLAKLLEVMVNQKIKGISDEIASKNILDKLKAIPNNKDTAAQSWDALAVDLAEIQGKLWSGQSAVSKQMGTALGKAMLDFDKYLRSSLPQKTEQGKEDEITDKDIESLLA